MQSCSAFKLSSKKNTLRHAMKISAIHVNIATKASPKNHIVRNIQAHVNFEQSGNTIQICLISPRGISSFSKKLRTTIMLKKLFEYMPNINNCQTEFPHPRLKFHQQDYYIVNRPSDKLRYKTSFTKQTMHSGGRGPVPISGGFQRALLRR